MKKDPAKLRELAFYYPNPMWSYGDWIKNLVLFFDGIALLVPKYMRRRPEEIDPAIVAGLKQHGLLEIIEPEKAVDKTATEKLAMAMTDVITSGALDDLAEEQTAFAELSMSRLGYYGDEGLYKMIFEELKKRGPARDSEDKCRSRCTRKCAPLCLYSCRKSFDPTAANSMLGSVRPPIWATWFAPSRSFSPSRPIRPLDGRRVRPQYR